MLYASFFSTKVPMYHVYKLKIRAFNFCVFSYRWVIPFRVKACHSEKKLLKSIFTWFKTEKISTFVESFANVRNNCFYLVSLTCFTNMIFMFFKRGENLIIVRFICAGLFYVPLRFNWVSRNMSYYFPFLLVSNGGSRKSPAARELKN